MTDRSTPRTHTLIRVVRATGAVAAAGLAATVVARAALTRPRRPKKTHRHANAPARQGIEQRLSELIQIETVSANIDRSGLEPFKQFGQRIAALYPLVGEHLEKSTVTDLGILMRWPGAASERPLVLMAHYDVVPAHEDEGWDAPPFSGTIRDGKVWGRGTLDDKGSLVSILDAVENLLATGFRPAQDVYLSFGGNEETYGEAAKQIAAELSRRGVEPWMVLDEGGAVVPSPLPGIDKQVAVVGVTEKGVMTVRLSVTNPGGHASAPTKGAATSILAEALLRLERHRFPHRLPQPMHDLLTTLAPYSPFGMRLILANLWLFQAPLVQVLAAADGEKAAMVRTTLAVTQVHAGTANNVLAPSGYAILNIRIAPGERVEDVQSAIVSSLEGLPIEVDIEEAYDPSPLADSDNHQFGLIRSAVANAYPDAVTSPYVMLAASDSRHFHARWPQVYRFAPLFMSQEQRQSVHSRGEYVTIDALKRAETFYQTLIRSLT